MAAVELYSISEGDSLYNSRTVELKSELQIYLNQIRNILSSENGSVLGASDMGLDLESLVYEMDLDEAEIRNQIVQQITTFCSYYNLFKTEIIVRFSKGIVREVCFIDFVIDSTRALQFRIS